MFNDNLKMQVNNMIIQKFNYALPLNHYSLKRALLWGNCAAHFQQARKETGKKRVVHFLIAALLFIPIISQIASIFEKIIIQTNVRKIYFEERKKLVLQSSNQSSLYNHDNHMQARVVSMSKKTLVSIEDEVDAGPISGEFETKDLEDFERVYIDGDGQCLFNSIGYFIQGFSGYKNFRGQVAHALSINQEYRHSFGYSETKKPNSEEYWTFEDYINDIRVMPEYQGTEERPLYDQNDPLSRRGWGSQLEVRVIHDLLQRPICLYLEDQKKFSIYPYDLTLEEAKKNEQTLFIYYDGEGHFDAMPLKSETGY